MTSRELLKLYKDSLYSYNQLRSLLIKAELGFGKRFKDNMDDINKQLENKFAKAIGEAHAEEVKNIVAGEK